jgi:hypothetical protein
MSDPMKVTEVVGEPREKDINGPMFIHKLKVMKRGGEPFEAELMKRSKDGPKVDEVLNVAKVDPGKGDYPPTLRLEKPQGQFGGGGGGPRGKSPEEQRSIERMNAAKIAAEMLQGVYGNISDDQFREEFNRVGEMVHAFVSKPA